MRKLSGSSRKKPPPSDASPPDFSPVSALPWVRLRSARHHPLLYQRMIASADPAARPGDLVAVYDKDRRLFGHAIYNPRSQIVLRMLRHGTEPIDEPFWRERLAAAVRLRRETLRLDEITDAYRLVHAEGDGLSGLVVERYADYLAFEVFALGMFQRVDLIARLLAEELGPPEAEEPLREWKRVVRADRRTEELEGFRAPAPDAEEARRVVIREHGIRFRVDLEAGHKTGFFCDQRDNRRAFAAFCRDATVLDLCCYTGGFGLAAKVVGRAGDVTSVDLDETALALARENANLNQVRVGYVHADAFPYLRQMIANGRSYDAVVLDPPKLIPTREGFTDGRQRYLDLNKMALRLVRPGGVLLTCSCSGLLSPADFLDVIRQAARIAERRAVVFNLTGAASDHPIALDCPETAYLKAVWLRVL